MKHLKTMAILGASWVLASQLATAEIIYLYDHTSPTNQRLVSINSATPGTIISDIALTGLLPADANTAAEFLIGIDFRPADGLLYAFKTNGGVNGNVVQISTATGAVTSIGGPVAAPNGNRRGLDFNPVTGLMATLTNADENRRYDPVTGTLNSTLSPLVYAPGDVNFGADPTITAAAYTTNPGNGSTTLYGIDSALNTLAFITGNIATVGPLGITTQTGFNGFDISGSSGAAYAVFRVNNSSGLYTIDLSTGAATLLGAIGTGAQTFDGLSVQPAAVTGVPEPSTFALLGFGTLALALLRRKSR